MELLTELSPVGTCGDVVATTEGATASLAIDAHDLAGGDELATQGAGLAGGRKRSEHSLSAVHDDSLRAVFDAGRLEDELKKDLPKALRELADSVEAGHFDLWATGVIGTGLAQHWADQRSHFMISLRLATKVRKQLDVKGLENVE